MEREFDDHVHGSIGKALSLMIDNQEEEVGAQSSVEASSPFWLHDPPWFPIEDYVSRFKQFVDTSSETFIVALLYMDRLALADEAYQIAANNVHCLVLACCVLAHKYYDEDPTPNSLLAEVGGIEVGILNRLELEVLKGLHFNLEVPLEAFVHYRRQIARGAIARGLLKEDQKDAWSSPSWCPRDKPG